MSIQEDALRALELQQLLADLNQEKALIHARIMHQYPVLKEGGSILVGRIKITGRLIRPGDASRWERDNLPKTSTNHVIKLSVKEEKQ